MVKHKVACAFSALTVMIGSILLSPISIYADGACSTVSSEELAATTEMSVCIGSFDDLKLALTNVGINKITLIDNISKDGEGIIVGRPLTLDLAGYVLSIGTRSGAFSVPSNTAVEVTGEGAILTVEDSSELKTGEIRYLPTGTTAPRTIHIDAGTKLILNSGTIYAPFGSNNGGGSTIMYSAGASFEMNGGRIENTDGITSTSSYGVNLKTNNSSFKMTGGEIVVSGNALAATNSNTASIEITGGLLVSLNTKAIDITSARATGSITGIAVEDAVISGNITVDNVAVSNTLNIKGGQPVFTNTLVNGLTTVAGGNTVIDHGTVLAGGLVYQSATTASLIINVDAIVNDTSQVGKTTSASFTDATTGEKVSTSYETFGALIINGGTFNGDFQIASAEQIETANNARRDFVENYNERSGKTPLTYADVAMVPEIRNGRFAAEPDESAIVSEYEAEMDGGYWTIVPMNIDWMEKGFIESNPEADDEAYVTVEFNAPLVADRRAELLATIANTDEFTVTGAGELVGVIEIDMVDRDHEVIEVKDSDLLVYTDIDEDTHEMLSSYDELFMVYFENGVEKERYPVALEDEGFSFETSHLSAYGLVGVNNTTGGDEEEGEESSSSVAAPDSGTMTIAGASAMVSSLVTSIVIGILVSITSFAYLIRRR